MKLLCLVCSTVLIFVAMDSSKSDLKPWRFKVRDNSDHVGTMCITGDCDSLGNWSTNFLIPLNFDKLVCYTKILLWVRIANVNIEYVL